MSRVLNIALLISFSFVYLDWGHDGAEFIWQLEAFTFIGPVPNLVLLANPFFILSFVGQLLLVISTIKSPPSRRMTRYGFAFLSGIVILVLLIGLIMMKGKMILSTLPFLVLASIFIVKSRHTKLSKQAI
jgi:hypothetical protein